MGSDAGLPLILIQLAQLGPLTLALALALSSSSSSDSNSNSNSFPPKRKQASPSLSLRQLGAQDKREPQTGADLPPLQQALHFHSASRSIKLSALVWSPNARASGPFLAFSASVGRQCLPAIDMGGKLFLS